MGVLFRASLGFAIAFSMLQPRASRQWLDTALLDRLHSQCAAGLPLCDGAKAAFAKEAGLIHGIGGAGR